jgi:hypothetical protein
MKLTPTLGGAYSGSFGGLTAARNRGGQYLRRRAVPTNPGTEAQVNTRAQFAAAAASWSLLLTEEMRMGWNGYAAAVPWVNSLGETCHLSGQQMFVRTQAFALLLNSFAFTPSSAIDPPVINQLGPSIGYSNVQIINAAGPPATSTIGITLTEPVTSVTVAIFLGIQPSNPGVFYYKGPYRLAAVVEAYSGASPSANLLAATQPWAMQGLASPVAGNLHYGYYRMITADGSNRLGTPVRFGPVLVA